MKDQIPINPIAILAAVLFHHDEKATVKIKHDDSAEESDVDISIINIDREGQNLVCTMPIDLMMAYTNSPYEFSMRVVQGVAVMTFAKRVAAPALVSSNGNPIASGNPTLDKLLAKIGL